MRVIILTALLPVLLALTGIAPSSPAAAVDRHAAGADRVGRGLGGGSAAAAADQFPASWMFGAMIGSACCSTGVIERSCRRRCAMALVGIGALIGARFARMKIRTLLSHVNAALGSFAVAIVISAVFSR